MQDAKQPRMVRTRHKAVRRLVAELEHQFGDGSAAAMRGPECVFDAAAMRRQLEQADRNLQQAQTRHQEQLAEVAGLRVVRDRHAATLRQQLQTARKVIHAAGGFQAVLLVFGNATRMPAGAEEILLVARRVGERLRDPELAFACELPGVHLDVGLLARSFETPVRALARALEELNMALFASTDAGVAYRTVRESTDRLVVHLIPVLNAIRKFERQQPRDPRSGDAGDAAPPQPPPEPPGRTSAAATAGEPPAPGSEDPGTSDPSEDPGTSSPGTSSPAPGSDPTSPDPTSPDPTLPDPAPPSTRPPGGDAAPADESAAPRKARPKTPDIET